MSAIVEESLAAGASALLESENRSERDAQVIVRALVEIDLVSGFETEAHRTERGLDSPHPDKGPRSGSRYAG